MSSLEAKTVSCSLKYSQQLVQRVWWRLGLNQCLLEEHGCFFKNICRSGAEEEVTQSAKELSEGQYHLRREPSQLEGLELLHTRSQAEVGGTPGRG